MIANYSVTKEQAVEHILSLLASLGETERMICYLKPTDVGSQLARAFADRGQLPPTAERICFWQRRLGYDLFVLEKLSARGENVRIFEIPGAGYDLAAESSAHFLQTSSP